MIPITQLIRELKPNRVVHGISAVFLPCLSDGRPDFPSFETILMRVANSGLVPAINMDTGFGPQLSSIQRVEVMRFTRNRIGSRPFVAGAMPFGTPGDALSAYRSEIAAITGLGGIPIIFQSPWLTSSSDIVESYRQILVGCKQALAFELSSEFASFGRIYDLATWRGLLDIPALVGAKHSSLDRRMELERLTLIKKTRPDFKLYTGNDLAIDMIMWGSDYLLGLSTFEPEAFAQRDVWWAAGDDRFFALNDALQMLGAITFRTPIPAYKASAAAYLSVPGRPKLLTHPAAAQRPEWEGELLEAARARIAQAMRAPH